MSLRGHILRIFLVPRSVVHGHGGLGSRLGLDEAMKMPITAPVRTAEALEKEIERSLQKQEPPYLFSIN